MAPQARFIDNGEYCKRDDAGTFQLRKRVNGKYLLPRIELAPSAEEAPAYLYGLALRAEDGPDVLLDAVSSLRFPEVSKPLKLNKRIVLPGLPLEIELEESAQCNLILEVRHHENDTTIFDRTEKTPFSVSLSLSLKKPQPVPNPKPDPWLDEPEAAGETEETVSSGLGEPKNISVHPLRLPLIVGKGPALLTIEVSPGHSLTPPAITLAHPENIEERELAKRLDQALKVPMKPLESGSMEGRIWEAKIALDLPEGVKARLWPKFDDRPKSILLRTRAGDLEIEHELEIDRTENLFPGWVALDFGTSNSTATMFDPKRVEPMRGLPEEQRTWLRRSFITLLERSGPDAMPGTSASGGALWEEWQRLLDDIGKTLPEGKDLESVVETFRAGNEKAMYEVLRQIELWLTTTSPELQNLVCQRLNQIYHEVLRIPSLQDLFLVPVELEQIPGSTEIPSEVEIASIDPTATEPLESGRPEIEMGQAVRKARRELIEQGSEPEPGRFHKMLKSYMGTEQSLDIVDRQGNRKEKLSIDRLLQAVWGKLLALTDEFRTRNPTSYSKGKIRRAVVTYPTVSPPMVRRKIEDLVEELGVTSVQIAYDEAVSSAIFFLMREFGPTPELGLEAFKAKCAQGTSDDGQPSWSQNVLVFDIGGGTTDMALIRLTLVDETDRAFNEGEDRGAGGHYYKMIPRLLGSSGHMQLGGELVTLRTFLLLKAVLADNLLTLSGPDGPLSDRIRDLDKIFRIDDNYRKGSLVQYTFAQREEQSSYDLALAAAETVVPTRWKDDPKRLWTFFRLWEWAEEAKIHLGKVRELNAASAIYEVDSTKMRGLLDHIGVELNTGKDQDLNATLTQEHFEKAVGPDIREAVMIAKGLLESRLPVRKGEERQGPITREPMDWLILSGKTCNLALVEREIRSVFSGVDYFIWNPERITFDPDFAKLSTSIGACYAESLRQFAFNPQGAKNILRKGLNQLYFAVNNLFFFLPSSFKRVIAGGPTTEVFNANTQLLQIDGESMGKARTKWEPAPLETAIQREDYEGSAQHLWGNFPGELLARKLSFSDEEWRSEIQHQLEINQKLEIRIRLCRGRPHYVVPEDLASVNIYRSLGTTADDESPNDNLLWDIGIALFSGGQAYVGQMEKSIFNCGTPFEESFHGASDDNEAIAGMISISLEEDDFFRNNKMTFFRRREGETNWEHIGELSKPGVPSNFPRRYRATLDKSGRLCLHAGEVPYWASLSEDVLKVTEGCVYSRPLYDAESKIEKDRDPLSGEH
jgi:hypothetical protein